MMALRLEGLKEELCQLKNRICIKLKQGVTEVVLNNFLSEGDELIKEIKQELNKTSQLTKEEMYNLFFNINNSWNRFKVTCKTNPGKLIGNSSVVINIPNSSSSEFDFRPSDNQFETNLNLVKSVNLLEQTSQSLHRASQKARETEEIGTSTLSELGGQRESLLRTRTRLDDTNQNLRKTHLILRTLHRQVLTNKFFLYLIVILEIMIGGLLIYSKLKKK